MKFVFGGAYQGKLDYALKEFGIGKEEVYTCTEENWDIFSEAKDFGLIDKIEDFCWAAYRNGLEAKDVLKEHEDILKNKVVVSRDVSQGLVPMDKDERAYREMMGRMMIYLTSISDEIYRVFCGLGQKIK